MLSQLLVHDVTLVRSDVAENLDGACSVPAYLVIEVQSLLHLLGGGILEKYSQCDAIFDTLRSALCLV